MISISMIQLGFSNETLYPLSLFAIDEIISLLLNEERYLQGWREQNPVRVVKICHQDPHG